jgi:hypothetical protein
MTTVHCAVCVNKLEGDQDHVRVKADIIYVEDRHEKEGYAFHPECWRRVSKGWL